VLKQRPLLAIPNNRTYLTFKALRVPHECISGLIISRRAIREFNLTERSVAPHPACHGSARNAVQADNLRIPPTSCPTRREGARTGDTTASGSVATAKLAQNELAGQPPATPGTGEAAVNATHTVDLPTPSTPVPAPDVVSSEVVRPSDVPVVPGSQRPEDGASAVPTPTPHDVHEIFAVANLATLTYFISCTQGGRRR
jgi:hypothetical protein